MNSAAARTLLACLCAVALGAWLGGAAAQLRTIPAEAKRGELRHLQDLVVELDGKAVRLSAGAQIRDTENRIVLPASLTSKVVVRYLPDAMGNLHRAWILSKEEAAASAPKPKPVPLPEPKKDDGKKADDAPPPKPSAPAAPFVAK